MTNVVDLAKATWPEVDAAIKAGLDTAIFAVGSTEQHGPHMPFATDTLIGDALCRRVASEIGGALIVPTISLGFSDAHMEFPGSLTAEPKVLAAVVNAYALSLRRHGFRRIAMIPSHGGNFGWLRAVALVLDQEHAGMHFEAFTDWPLLKEAFGEVMSKDGLAFDAPGLHAGEIETSIMLHLHPALVHMDRAECGCTGSRGDGRPFGGSIKEVSPIGVLGDPRNADAGRGNEYLSAWTALIARQLG